VGGGWLYRLLEFDFSQKHKATPILTFPRQTGNEQDCWYGKRSSENWDLWISDDLVHNQTTL